VTTSQKAVISLLIAVLLFGVFSVLAFTGLFDLFIGRLVNEDVFLFPTVMKVILLVSFFLTTFLIIFMLFNLKQDPLTVVQNRLKQLQISLLEQFYERKGEADWARWIRELDNRREEIRALLKRGIKTDSNKSVELDIMINRSWDELLVMMGNRRNLEITSNLPIPSNLATPGESSLDEEKIASILNKLLEARMVVSPQSSEKIELAEEIEILEELDEVDETKAPQVVSQIDIDNLATQIEFSPDTETEQTDERLFDDGLEIVSPFSTMVFDSLPERSSDTDDVVAGDAVAGKAGEAKEDQSNEKSGKEDDELNIATDGINTDSYVGEGLPIITTLFSGILSIAEVEPLEDFDAGKEGHKDGDIIREMEGVHFINENVLAPSPEVAVTLNREFKELVDEVTK